MSHLPLAYAIDWGWFRIGPPYIYLNIDPVIVKVGGLALRWYGLMYVVAILIALRVIQGYTKRKGFDQELVYRVLWWCIAAGLIGGRLYFVVQQPNLVSYYLAQPIHIIATWEGGMAFYGAIFLIIPTLIWRARVERVNPLVLIDAGVLFGAVGQIFGRIGNIINGDIIGYPSTLPWSTVYQHPNSWACLDPATCNVPVQPAAAYELLTNLVLLAVMLYLAKHVRRPGILMLVYLFSYAITQFFIFFTRANVVVSFLGLDWGLKQAQWTSLVLIVFLVPITFWVLKIAKPVPVGESAATYGIPQKGKHPLATKTLDGEIVKVEDGEVKQVEQPHSEVVIQEPAAEDEIPEKPALAEEEIEPLATGEPEEETKEESPIAELSPAQETPKEPEEVRPAGSHSEAQS